MNSLSIIIPSKTDANLGACVRAIRAAGETCPVIVVDDFDRPTRFLLPCDEPVDWQMGEKPFVFARNINIGIRAAAGDVVLLNDDALLKSPHGFTAMQRVAASHPEYGLIAATCNNVGNRRQWPQNKLGVRDEPRMVCFGSAFSSRGARSTWSACWTSGLSGMAATTMTIASGPEEPV